MESKRRKTLRLAEYDYRSPGYYYVTFCTHQRECSLAEINSDGVVLSEFARIVKQFWLQLPHHFMNVSLDEVQIMPNHVHAIIIIEEEFRKISNDPKPFLGRATLGQIIGYWKYQSSKQFNSLENGVRDLWQPNMFEHVIRNERELQEIRTYLRNNPAQWLEDIENPTNIERLRLAELERRLKATMLPPSIAQ